MLVKAEIIAIGLPLGPWPWGLTRGLQPPVQFRVPYLRKKDLAIEIDVVVKTYNLCEPYLLCLP